MINKNKIQPRRSLIFTTPLKHEMFSKAKLSGADIVCVELEDGISPKDKKMARSLAIKLFDDESSRDGIEKIIRINCPRDSFGLADIQAIVDTNNPPHGIMIPKVKTAEEIILIDNLFSERGHKTKFHIIIETNQGLECAYEIANCCKRIEALFFGGVDMAAELRCSSNWDSLLYARSRVVHAAASAGLDAIDVPYLDLNDLEGMKIEAIKAKDLGYCGKGSIHPKQIPILNEVFTPTKDELTRANKIITAFEKANTGLLVFEGKLIEKPVLREMYRILGIAKKMGLKY